MGFEPKTSELEVQRAIQLRHRGTYRTILGKYILKWLHYQAYFVWILNSYIDEICKNNVCGSFEIDKSCRCGNFEKTYRRVWFRGVMVSTLDSESKDPRSSLGGTCAKSFFFLPDIIQFCWISNQWRWRIKTRNKRNKKGACQKWEN